MPPRFLAMAFAVTALLVASPVFAQTRPAPPNILFLMADQLRGDCIGADGNRVIRTPNLDRLCAEGARFRCAYSSTPSCTPARGALLTGLSPWRHGQIGYGHVALEYRREMPGMLRDAGYDTLGVGKMHFTPQRNLHGFHRTILDESGRSFSVDFRSDYRAWFASVAPALDPDATGIGWNDYRAAAYALPENLHPTRWTADVAVNWLRDRRSPEPFFLMVSFARPHSPYDPPERFLKMYENVDVPAPSIGDWAAQNDIKADPNDHSLWRGNLGPDAPRRARRAYYGSVTFIDEQIGRILAVLQERGLLDRTLILVTADHGDMLGDHHLWRKTYAYEGSARIPMIIRWPSSLAAPRGQVLRRPVEIRDVLPTFLDAAGVPIAEKDFDGRSMLELVRGRGENWRNILDLEHAACYPGAEGWNALTDGRMKYIFHSQSGQEQLFDLENDPGERHDLAADPRQQDAVRTWRDRLVDHLAERGPEFVRDGRLVTPRKRIIYSPNYPQDPDEVSRAATRPAARRQNRRP